MAVYCRGPFIAILLDSQNCPSSFTHSIVIDLSTVDGGHGFGLRERQNGPTHDAELGAIWTTVGNDLVHRFTAWLYDETRSV